MAKEGWVRGRRGQRSKQVVDEDRGGRDNKQSPPIQLRRPGPSAVGTAPVGRRGSSRRPVSDSGSGGRQLPSVWTRGGRVVKKERAALPPPDPLRTLWLFDRQTSSVETLFFDISGVVRAPASPFLAQNGFEGNVMREGLLGCRPRDPPHCKNKSLNT